MIGHHPDNKTDQMEGGGVSRLRLRTDSLDSIGETDSLSSADQDGHDDLEPG